MATSWAGQFSIFCVFRAVVTELYFIFWMKLYGFYTYNKYSHKEAEYKKKKQNQITNPNLLHQTSG